jgi:hypothetical protein
MLRKLIAAAALSALAIATVAVAQEPTPTSPAPPAPPTNVSVRVESVLLDENNFPLPPDRQQHTAVVTWEFEGEADFLEVGRQGRWTGDVAPPVVPVGPEFPPGPGELRMRIPHPAMGWCFYVRAVRGEAESWSERACMVEPPSAGPVGTLVAFHYSSLTQIWSPPIGTAGDHYGWVTLEANGVPCARIDLGTTSLQRAENPFVLLVPGGSMPAVCTTPGVLMAFNVRDTGHYLYEKFLFEPGVDRFISNLAPAPPHSVSPFLTPTVEPTPLAPVVGTGELAAGDRGLRELVAAAGAAGLLAAGALGLAAVALRPRR